jgi:hypothetical protein
LEKLLQVCSEILEVVNLFLTLAAKTYQTKSMVFKCSVVLAKEDTEVHFHALQSMTEQFQLYE